MRGPGGTVRLAATLAGLLVAVSGCVSQERSSPEGSGVPDGLGDETNNTTLLGPPPIDVYLRHDFTRGDVTRTVDIEPNSTLEVYDLHFAVMPNPNGPAGACATLLAKITIKDPTGAVYDEISAAPTQTGVSTGNSGGVCGTQKSFTNETGVPLGPPGRWTFEFTGVGVAMGIVIMDSEADGAPV